MNFKRTVLYACGLALAVGGPISLFSASDFAVKLRKNWLAGWTAKGAATPQPSVRRAIARGRVRSRRRDPGRPVAAGDPAHAQLWPRCCGST